MAAPARTLLIFALLSACVSVRADAQAARPVTDASGASVGSNPRGLTLVGDRLYFTAGGERSRGLWAVHEGNASRIDLPITALKRQPRDDWNDWRRATAEIVGTDGTWLYLGERGAAASGGADTLWAYDGKCVVATPDVKAGEGVQLGDAAYALVAPSSGGDRTQVPRLTRLKSGRPAESLDLTPHGFVRFGDRLWIAGKRGEEALALWSYDGERLDRHASASDSLAAQDEYEIRLSVAGGALYLSSGAKLWRIDGDRVVRVNRQGEDDISAPFDLLGHAFVYQSSSQGPGVFSPSFVRAVQGDSLTWGLHGEWGDLPDLSRSPRPGAGIRFDGGYYLWRGSGPLYRTQGDTLAAVEPRTASFGTVGDFTWIGADLYFTAGQWQNSRLWRIPEAR